MKTDFQLLHYTEVRRAAHAPAALLPGKDPKNAQQLQQRFCHLNFFPTTDVCNKCLNIQCNLLKWKSQENPNSEFLNFFM